MTAKKTIGYRIFTNIFTLSFIAIALSIGGQFIYAIIYVLFTVFYMVFTHKPGLFLPPVLDTARLYLTDIVPWIIAILIFLPGKRNVYRPVLRDCTHKEKGNTWWSIFLGILIGGGMNLFCALVAMWNEDIFIRFDSFNLLPALFIFACVFIQSSCEELICRSFLMGTLLRRYRMPWMAILFNSLLFGSLHLFNDGITVLSFVNIMLTGILFSLIYYFFDSMWCIFLAHTAWNYMQNIVLGLPNSGIVVPYSIFKLDAASARDSFAYNVGFGIEGTLVADGVLLLACIATVIIGKLVTHKKLFVRLPEDAFPGEALWNVKSAPVIEPKVEAAPELKEISEFNSSSETVELPMEEIARMLASATDETQNKDENENE